MMSDDPTIAITWDEWCDVVEFIEDHWPKTGSWLDPDKAKIVFADFQHFTHDMCMAAARRLFTQGSQGAPSPSKMMAEVRAVAGETGVSVVYEGPHQHVFGHVHPQQLYGGLFASQRGPGLRECVTCGQSSNCHCEDCRNDPWYDMELRSATTEELELQRQRRPM